MRTIAATALVVTALLGAALAKADEGVEVPASVEPAPIAARSAPSAHVVEGHTFSFRIDVSPCRGPGLRLDHVRLVERPESANGFKGAIVTADLFHPAHIEGLPCPKVRRIKTVRIRTKRPARGLVFFDGSSSPPRRVFPLHGPPAGD